MAHRGSEETLSEGEIVKTLSGWSNMNLKTAMEQAETVKEKLDLSRIEMALLKLYEHVLMLEGRLVEIRRAQENVRKLLEEDQ